MKSEHINRPHFPDNCFIIDISKQIKNISIRTITFKFGILVDFGVNILIEDRNLFSTRPVQQNNGFFTGDKIRLKQNSKNDGIFRAYSFEFSQNIFVEKDSSKNCKNYPNKKFKCYSECDQDFVKRSLKDLYSLQPFWAASVNDTVTLKAYEPEYSKIEAVIFNLYSGATASNCSLPCETTSTLSSLVYESDWPLDHLETENYLDITPSPKVMITRTDFPKVLLASALSSYGGSMGFWLGLGVVQLTQILLRYFKNGILFIRRI